MSIVVHFIHFIQIRNTTTIIVHIIFTESRSLTASYSLRSTRKKTNAWGVCNAIALLNRHSADVISGMYRGSDYRLIQHTHHRVLGIILIEPSGYAKNELVAFLHSDYRAMHCENNDAIKICGAKEMPVDWRAALIRVNTTSMDVSVGVFEAAIDL